MKNIFSENIRLKQSGTELDQKQTNELLFGPELEILNEEPNRNFDRMIMEIELRDGKTKISDVIITEPRVYEAIFHKVWFYRLADMLGVDKKVMDNYVKPKYVRDFFIKFVYARLGYRVLRELKAARKLAKMHNAKLFQFLKDEYYELIEIIAIEIYNEMLGKDFHQFVKSYSENKKLPVQQTLALIC